MARPPLTDTQRALLHTVAATLKRLRSEASLTQQQVADRIGADREYVAQCERGMVNFSIVRAIEFTDALGAPREALLAHPSDQPGERTHT